MNRFYQVAPRYTGGSPAMVNEHIAMRVAEDEKQAHESALSGIYGEFAKQRAEELGLLGIVEVVRETAKGWLVRDLITGEKRLRPFRADCPKCRAKKLNCKAGKLELHRYKDTRFDCTEGSGLDVHTRVEEWVEV